MRNVTEHREIPLADGTTVRLELAPVGDASPEDEYGGVGGVGGVTPVGRGARAAATLANAGLGVILRGLGPVLQDVHDAVSSAPHPPQEFTVQFGVQVGQDLKLGIVGANGNANLTISATWRPSEPSGRSEPSEPSVPAVPPSRPGPAA
ncbi:CU044_2847 family protein [Streptomyces sp. Inha503]|uniref:CU044_2847 family protein n=1 Tax=Streptomyces sp. Inha503 TaxID=3383314 RepID=UPI0039A0A992